MLDYRRIFRLRLGRRAELKAELEEEMRTHLELRVEELVRGGMSPREAREEAERRFGDLPKARRALYASAVAREARLRRGRLVEDALRDARLALRRIVREPGYAAVSISILALGIALTTVMFAVVDGVLLRPLPFPEADRLLSLQSVGEDGQPFDLASSANWYDWRAGTTTLAAIALYRQDRLSVAVRGEAFRATGASVGGAFFDVFRPPLVAGRALTAEDGEEDRPVTVLTRSFARTHFGSASEAVGRTMSIFGRPHEVVGVLDDAYAFPERSDLWVAFDVVPGSGALRNNINYQAVARLRPDVEPERVRAELDVVARGIRERDPEGATYAHAVGVLPLHDVLVSEAAETLRLLMAAVVAVLLVACANLAGLGLARARKRGPEVSLRMALGSRRAQIARQLLVEYLVLALLGGVAGFGVAWLLGGALIDRLTLELPRASAVSLDVRVAFFTAALAIGAGLAAGVAPAVLTSRLGVARAGRRTVRGGRGLPGGTLVGAEVALALAVLVGGGLLLRSLQAVAARDLGYDPEGVVVAEVDLNGEAYAAGDRSVEYWRVLLDDLQRSPAVRSAAVANWIPTGISGKSFLSLPENPEPDFGAGYRVVSDDYFETLDMSLVEGRGFGPGDVFGSERVTVVNRSLAEVAWPDRSPLGRQIAAPSMESWMHQGSTPWLTVVGVVEDIRHDGHESELEPELYVVHRQVPPWTRSMNVVVHGTGVDRARLGAIVREAIRASDASIAAEVRWLDDRVADLLRERVLTQRILAGFGLMALLLVCLGIYGLVSHAAAQRTREMAVRAALGARRTGLLGLMLGGAARVLMIGTVGGLAAAYALSGLLESQVLGVSATDPWAFAGAALLLGAVGLVAALVPSLRASRLDPVQALRSE